MIVFDHVSKVYPNGTVGLDDVNLTIQDGEILGLVGESGSGKSVTAMSVASSSPSSAAPARANPRCCGR